jgi:RNA polymerase sigma factor (sigma-70 family)
MSAVTADSVAHLLRELAPRVLGAVARRHDDFGAAEDAVQEALIAASRQWPVAGLPDNPRGWLYRVAMRRLMDHVRSEDARRRREEVAGDEAMGDAPPRADDELGPDRDDSLLLLFMCGHPALTPSSAIALTLRAVGGLTTAEIASAFLVPEATMAQRISRAKATIKTSGVPFALPEPGDREERLDAVLHVLYLMFNEGYAATSGRGLQRVDLSDEAIRLGRLLHAQLPDDGEVGGLLALMLLTDARRAARTGPAGQLIPLDEQDRGRWDPGLIAEGTTILSRALAGGAIGAYQLQAAVAAAHDAAPRVEDTDWSRILALYELLKAMSDNPMVALNHAIASAMVHGAAAGLALLEPLDSDPRIAGHYRLDAVRGHLYDRAGDRAKAIEHYRSASERTASIPERDYLLMKAARLR